MINAGETVQTIVRKLEQYDDKPAITRFNRLYGDKILKKLGVTLIDPDDVTMIPELLKGKT